MTQITYSEVIAFWREAGPSKWFGGGPAFDAEIRERFSDTHLAAARGDLADWENTAEGALALLLLVPALRASRGCRVPGAGRGLV